MNGIVFFLFFYKYLRDVFFFVVFDCGSVFVSDCSIIFCNLKNEFYLYERFIDLDFIFGIGDNLIIGYCKEDNYRDI